MKYRTINSAMKAMLTPGAKPERVCIIKGPTMRIDDATEAAFSIKGVWFFADTEFKRFCHINVQDLAWFVGYIEGKEPATIQDFESLDDMVDWYHWDYQNEPDFFAVDHEDLPL